MNYETVLANILAIIKKDDTSPSESFVESVLKRLVSFGYELKDDDSWAVSFAIQKVENHIKNSCNTTSVPEGLFNVAVDMVCGEFLLTKRQTGQLTLTDLDFGSVVTSIKEGDTQVNFGGDSDDAVFTTFLNWLIRGGEGDLVCYRKMQW